MDSLLLLELSWPARAVPTSHDGGSSVDVRLQRLLLSAILHTVAFIALTYACFMALLSKAPAARGVKSVFWEAKLPKFNLGKFSIPVYHIFYIILKELHLFGSSLFLILKKKILHANDLASQDFEFEPSIMGNLGLHND